MALPSTGPISMAMVRAELGRSGQIRFGESDVRSLAQRPSGKIAKSDLRGKSAATVMVLEAGRYFDQWVSPVSSNHGYAWGYGAAGSLTPDRFNGVLCTAICFNNNQLEIRFEDIQPKSMWSTLTISGLGTFHSSQADSFSTGTYPDSTTWKFNRAMPTDWVGNTHTVTFT